METKILADTDILLKVYRGDKTKYQQLKLIKEDFSVSVITASEILNGAKNLKQLASTKKELKSYSVLHLNQEISMKALQLFSQYSVSKQIKIGDVLIAVTALHYNLQLYTDNKKDFNFISGIKFYTEKP